MAIFIEHPIPINVLRQLLRLDPETGRLYWLPRGPEWFSATSRSADRAAKAWNARDAGTEALISVSRKGYLHGKIFGRFYATHRVAFALANGRWPDADVDHRDLAKWNNKPSNLRDATRSQNLRNVGSRGGASGYCGVHWHKQRARWQAVCSDDLGRKRSLGVYSDPVEAARAYDAAARRWHGEFARLNFEEAA